MDNVNKIIQNMITNGESIEKVLNYVKNDCKNEHLTPKTLGMLFELYADVKYDEDDPSSGFSRVVTVEELKNIHRDFVSTNGNHWARSDVNYLGKKYIIIRNKRSGKTFSVKLDGINNKSLKKNRKIRKDIRDKLSRQRCVILDIGTNIQVDHKDGHYDDPKNQDTSTQKESDFQPLSAAANDAKRSHCNNCIKEGKRYDATRLGYSQAFLYGDENTKSCQGCYWYDPKLFNKTISKDYKKEK